MEDEFECLADKGDQDRHFDEEFVKNSVPSRNYRDFRITICLSLLGDRPYPETRILACLGV